MSFAFGSTVLTYNAHEHAIEEQWFGFVEPRTINMEQLTVGDYIETSYGFDKVTTIVTYDCPIGVASLSTVLGLRATADVVILHGDTWRAVSTVTPPTLQQCTGLVSIETELFNNIVVDAVQCMVCPRIPPAPQALKHVSLRMFGYPDVVGGPPTSRL